MSNHYNFIDSLSMKITRTGIIGSNYHDDYQHIIDYFHSRTSRKSSYDLTFDGSREQFIHTPIFNNLLYIRTADDVFNSHLISKINDSDRDLSLNLQPKYQQIDYNKHNDAVIVLPGTNYLYDISPEFLDILNELGVAFKLHPVTNNKDQFMLFNCYQNVIHDFFSGIDVITNADTVYSSDSSELGLIANYLGKNVERYYINDLRGAYYALYNNIDDMNIWLNSAKSGIIRVDYYKEDIDAYIKHYRSHYDDQCSLY